MLETFLHSQLVRNTLRSEEEKESFQAVDKSMTTITIFFFTMFTAKKNTPRYNSVIQKVSKFVIHCSKPLRDHIFFSNTLEE